MAWELGAHGSEVALADRPVEILGDRAGHAPNFLQMQRDQHRHDMRNHSDIVCLNKADRLKHYGLHFAKYVGRLARGERESKPIDRTVIDTLLVCLSAANALHQNLSEIELTFTRICLTERQNYYI